MSSSARKPSRHPPVVSVGCNCRRARIAAFSFRRMHNQRIPRTKAATSSSTTTSSSSKNSSSAAAPPSSSSSWDRFLSAEDTSAASPNCVVGGGVAVVKTSDDPYYDFRRSMVQMILENEIYGRDDLYELLHCFLSLNSPYHHGVILRVFTEIVGEILF